MPDVEKSDQRPLGDLTLPLPVRRTFHVTLEAADAGAMTKDPMPAAEDHQPRQDCESSDVAPMGQACVPAEQQGIHGVFQNKPSGAFPTGW